MLNKAKAYGNQCQFLDILGGERQIESNLHISLQGSDPLDEIKQMLAD